MSHNNNEENKIDDSYGLKKTSNNNIQDNSIKNPVGFGRFPVGRHGMPVPKAKNFKGTLIRLWKYFGREGKVLLALSLLILISSAIGLSIPYLVGRSIDSMISENNIVDIGLLGLIVTTLIVAYVIDGFIIFLQGWIMAGVSHRIVKRLRSSLFDKLQKLPVSFFDIHTHGEVMSRLSNDIENVSSTISQSATQLISSALIIGGSFIMMVILSPLLTVASVVVIPLVFLVSRTIARKTKILFREQQKVLGRLNGHIEETISGILVVKAFNHEDKVIEEFDKINNQLCDVGIKAQIWSGFIMPLMNVINNLGFAVVAGVGGVLAVNELITVGIIASFLSYSRQFVRPLNEVASIFNTLQSAVASAERVFEVLDQEEEPEDLSNAKFLENPKGHVIFEDVSFGYRPHVSILKNISFEVKAGTSIALVGPTGAGKTTIINLLTRFYDVTSGAIFLDGVDIREYTRDSFRKSFGIVLQDTYLFSGTIKENIKYGCLDATDEEVERAAFLANADVFIKRLPNEYETVLSESGGNLSQGQRQLLAIARVILANPAILILDEATSNVDTRTELHIQEGMLKLMEERTSFIIAHRLSTIRDANIIMVIDNGEIVEKGDHDSLMEKKGIYHNLYFSQFENI